MADTIASPQRRSVGDPLLTAACLHVRYGRISALKGVSLTVGRNDIVAILGANGAGKTTLMRALAGLEPVYQGDVRFLGRSISSVACHKRVRLGIALVQEGRSVFAPLTVEENLRLGMVSEGYLGKQKEFHSRAERILEIFPPLRDRRGIRAGELSGGQQQMLAIGRALMSNPVLLLLDEPSLGLAPLIVEDLFEKLVDLNESGGLSIILAEQNTDYALAIADFGYVLQTGAVAVEGDAKQLTERVDIEDIYLGRSPAPKGSEPAISR